MKHLKKDTGGYALLYVLVIVMVLVAISMMICTVALRNLQSQQAAVERMADKYAAQGEIEKIKAKIEALKTIETGDTKGKAEESACSAYEATIRAIDGCREVSQENSTYSIAVQKEVEGVTIKATIIAIVELASDEPETDESGILTEEAKCSIKTTSCTFTAYTIETTGGDAG